MKFKPHNYQRTAIKHIIDNNFAALFMEMGLGKTVTTLTAIDILKNEYLDANKVLVIAPKRVAEHTWANECEKWNHLKHLKVSKILGTEKQRKEAMAVSADIYVINRENVAWLVALTGSKWQYDTVIIDELSSFKSAKSQRFKALRAVRPQMTRVIGLTGTPAPNGLIDLWPQLYLLDMGERLGKTITNYRNQYFKPGRRNGQIVFNYKLQSDEAADQIQTKIGDICISMKAEDYLDMPKRIDLNKQIVLPESLKAQYDDFEKRQVLEFIEELGDRTITAANAAALTNKLLQFSNGAVYDSENKSIYYEIHDEKIEELGEIMEAANGKPVLVLYNFRSDVERIMKKLKAYKPKTMDTPNVVDRWNRGEISMLLGHPASMGHGLNLQFGGHLMAWFGLNWSLELYQQAVARLDRQGQQYPVINNLLICAGTYDERVLEALSDKAQTQNRVMDSVKALVQKYS